MSTVPGVVGLQPRGSQGQGESDATVLEVEAQAGVDIRADVARAVVGAGFDLLSLQQVGMSLEEIFLHLTTSEGTAEAPVEGLEPETAAEAPEETEVPS